MKFDAFEILRSEKELNEFGYYAEIRSRIAEAFVLDLSILAKLEKNKLAREQLVRIYTKNAVAMACVEMDSDAKFHFLLDSGKEIYKRFLFITAPLVREFNLAYLNKRQLVESLVGQNKTYIFEMTRNFQQLVITLDGEQFARFLKYKERIATIFNRMPTGTKFEVLDLLLSKELYILDIPEEKLLDLFSTKVTSPDKVKMKVNKLIQK